jgi:hypothetical protein
MDDRPTDSIPFTDGSIRNVLIDHDGKQYLLDDDGNRVYDVWV